MSDILSDIDALLDGPQAAAPEAPAETAKETTYLAPVIPDGNQGWDKAEYGQRAPETSGVEAMMSVRHNPWHAIGNVIPEALRATDIQTVLDAAGMNWTVSKRPLQVAAKAVRNVTEVEDGDDIVTTTWEDFSLPTPDFYGIVRDDTQKVLGVVKRAYTPFQNLDALEFVNDLLQNEGVTIETAGVLYEGARVWVLANIPRDMTIAGDVHVPYLCISTTHDGSGSVRADLTMMRVECRNSLRWAIRNIQLIDALKEHGIDNPSPSWTHRHSTNVKAKATDARRMLGFASDFIDAYAAEIEEMMAKVVTPKAFEKLVAEFLPIDSSATDRQVSNVEEKRDKVRALYESPADGGKFKGTGWGALQAFSSYDLWGADLRGGEKTRPTRQIVRLLDGTIEKRTTAVKDRILALR